MSSFLRSLKHVRYIGSINHVRINESHQIFRYMSHTLNDTVVQKSSDMNTVDPDLQFPKNFQLNFLGLSNLVTSPTSSTLLPAVMDQIIARVENPPDNNNKFPELLLFLCSDCTLLMYMPQERLQYITTLWKLFDSHNVSLNLQHYNALLKFYVENDDTFSPIEFLATIKKKGILPDATTYEWVLHCYCKQGNITEALEVLRCMREHGCDINENIFNLLILGYSKAGYLTSAINILNDMEQLNIVSSEKTYRAIMCAYARMNKTTKVNEILSYCKQKGISLSNESILDVIYTLALLNNKDCIYEMLQEIKTLHMIGNEIRFLSKFIEINQIDLATKVFDLLLLRAKKHIRLDLIKFFLNKLIHSNTPVENITEICEFIRIKYKYSDIYIKAIYYSFSSNNISITLELMKNLKLTGEKIRPHYFWPILVSFGKKNDVQGILSTLSTMVKTFKVIPCTDTLTQYVIPQLFFPILEIPHKLVSCGIPSKIIHNAVLCDILNAGKTRVAWNYIKCYPSNYEPSILMNALIKALRKTSDFTNFLNILKTMFSNENPEENCIGEVILMIMDWLKSHPKRILELLRFVRKNKLSMPDEIHKNLLSILGVRSSYSAESDVAEMDSVSEEEIKLSAEESLISHLSHEDVMKLYSNFLELKSNNRKIDISVYMTLANYFFKNDLREDGKNILMHLTTDYPVLKSLKHAFKHARLLISSGYSDVAGKIIKNTGKSIKTNEIINREIVLECELLLDDALKSCNEQEITEFCDILSEIQYMLPSHVAYARIMFYISNHDATKALKTVESLCRNYHYLPGLKKLTQFIVSLDDSNLLQEFTNIAMTVYQPSYILGELLFAFLKKDCIKEATQIIKMLAAEKKTFSVIQNNVTYIIKEKDDKTLQKLINCSRNHPDMDRYLIYLWLFEIYESSNDYKKAKDLWKQMEEDEIIIPFSGVKRLVKLFMRNTVDFSFIHDV